jgi:hypothetical protein
MELFSLQKCVYTQIRRKKVVQWGIRGEVRLVLAGVAATVALVVGAPSAMAALPQAPALPAQQTVDSATSTVQSTATAAVGTVQQQAANEVAAAQQTTSRVAPPPAAPATPRLPRQHVTPPQTPAVPRVALPAPPVDTARAVEGVGGETRAYREKLVQPLTDGPGAKPISDVVALVGNALGNALRKIAPQVGSLLAPVQPLLADLSANLRGGLDLPHLLAVVSPGEGQTLGATAERGAAPAPPSAGATMPPAVEGAQHGTASHSFQAASARPPAAEVGGRPESPPSGTAPAPVAGGAAPSSSGGLFFVPLLGLLVLAALAAPRLMRRLDALPAFVRPEPFLCALERPG